MNMISKKPLPAPKSNVLLFPARIAERETDRKEQISPDPVKPTLSITNDEGNVYQYRSEFDDFRAAENEMFGAHFRHARKNGDFVDTQGNKIDQRYLDEGALHRTKVRLVEAQVAAGATKEKLDSGFPCLSAIRKKDGNIVQVSKGDNRRAFEIIAQLVRLDFAAANREYLSKTIDDFSFEDGDVDFSSNGKHNPSATMVAAQREKTSMETISYTDPKT